MSLRVSVDQRRVDFVETPGEDAEGENEWRREKGGEVVVDFGWEGDEGRLGVCACACACSVGDGSGIRKRSDEVPMFNSWHFIAFTIVPASCLPDE